MKSTTYIALFVSIIMYTNACSLQSDEQLSESLQITQKSVFIPLDSIGLATYATASFIFREGDQDLLYTYNRPNSSIDVFNLSQKKFVNRTPIRHEGPNRVNKVYSLFVTNPDSIYIMGGRTLYLLNSQGQLAQKYSLLFSKPDYEDEGFFHAPNEAYINIKENVLTGFFSRSNPRGINSLSKPLLGQYNLKTRDLTFAQIYYPDFLKNTKQVYPSIRPNLHFTGNKVYYNFTMASAFFSYDFGSKKTTSFEAKSNYSQNMAKGQNLLNPISDYYNENTIFKRLQPYPGKPYFYRTHWGSQSKKTLEGTPTNASTKPGYIMFFDQELNILKEIELDTGCYIDGSFSTEEGIFFWAKDGKNEDEIKLCRYTLENP